MRNRILPIEKKCNTQEQLHLWLLRVRLVDSRGDVGMVARWFIEWVVGLVHFSDDAMVVGSILVKVVVLCSILLDQLLCSDLKKMAIGASISLVLNFDSFDLVQRMFAKKVTE